MFIAIPSVISVPSVVKNAICILPLAVPEPPFGLQPNANILIVSSTEKLQGDRWQKNVGQENLAWNRIMVSVSGL